MELPLNDSLERLQQQQLLQWNANDGLLQQQSKELYVLMLHLLSDDASGVLYGCEHVDAMDVLDEHGDAEVRVDVHVHADLVQLKFHRSFDVDEW